MEWAGHKFPIPLDVYKREHSIAMYTRQRYYLSTLYIINSLGISRNRIHRAPDELLRAWPLGAIFDSILALKIPSRKQWKNNENSAFTLVKYYIFYQRSLELYQNFLTFWPRVHSNLCFNLSSYPMLLLFLWLNMQDSSVDFNF
jgi:hypothetical protein